MKEVLLFLSCFCVLGPGALVAGQLDLKETCWRAEGGLGETRGPSERHGQHAGPTATPVRAPSRFQSWVRSEMRRSRAEEKLDLCHVMLECFHRDALCPSPGNDVKRSASWKTWRRPAVLLWVDRRASRRRFCTTGEMRRSSLRQSSVWGRRVNHPITEPGALVKAFCLQPWNYVSIHESWFILTCKFVFLLLKLNLLPDVIAEKSCEKISTTKPTSATKTRWSRWGPRSWSSKTWISTTRPWISECRPNM